MSVYFLHNKPGTRSSNIYHSLFQITHFEKSIEKEEIKEIQILIKDESIEFFYVVDNIEHPVNIQRHIHLFGFPLETPERIDNFLLNVTNLVAKIEAKIFNPKLNHRLYYSSEFTDKLTDKLNDQCKLTNIQEVLICLFDELENPESDINKYSPNAAKKIKENLYRSIVFMFIKKKFGFYKAIFDWKASNELVGELEVRTSYNEFLSIILDDSLGQKIPARKFDTGEWFENPQQELERLVVINKVHSIDDKRKKDVQKYFLKKHAILSALNLNSQINNVDYKIDANDDEIKETTICNRIKDFFYRKIILMQKVTLLCFVFVWILWMLQIFEFTNWILWIGIFSFFLSIGSVLFMQFNRDLFMPRAMVAMTLVLYAIIGSEVILKNQLFVDGRSIIISTLVGMALISFFLYAECQQHSPYYPVRNSKKLYNYKVIPILVYTFNVAMILVFFSHIIVTNKFIDNSKVLYNQEFGDEIDNLRQMQKLYQDFHNEIEIAQNQCAYTFFLLTKRNIETDKINFPIDVKFHDKLQNNFKDENFDIVNNNLYKYHKLRSEILIPKELENDIIARDMNIPFSVSSKHDEKVIQFGKYLKYSNIKIITDLASDYFGLKVADSICNKALLSLSSLNEIVMNKDSLEQLITYPSKIKIQDPNYGFIEKQDRIFILQLTPFGLKIYPNMFMLQVIIIMVIGLIGQLIVSDKTVTEPL